MAGSKNMAAIIVDRALQLGVSATMLDYFWWISRQLSQAQ